MSIYSGRQTNKRFQFAVNKWVVPALLIVLIAITGCLSLPTDLFLPQTPSPTLAPAQPRLIARSTLPLHEIWRRKLQPNVGITGWSVSSSEIFLARPEVLYAVDYEPNAKDSRWSHPIRALDPQTGKQRWKTEPFGYIYSFTSAPSMLIIASTYGIKAYEAVAGKEKWASDQPVPEHEGYTVFFEDSVLNFIDSKSGDFFYTQIDPETGKVGDFQKSEKVLTKIDSRYHYTWDTLDTLWLEDVKTNQAKQIITLPNGANLLREENILVIPYTERKPTVWRSLIVVDIPTEQKLWECSECLASDVAVDNGKLYAIRREGDLAEYDLKSGKLLGTVQFDGGRQIDPENTVYGVAVSGGYVVLYFGDTEELIALASK